MIASLTIIRYKKRFIPFALMAMAAHRIPIALQKGCTFWRLLGSGRDGGFSMKPDWQRWGLFAVWNSESDFNSFNNNSFISKWWNALAYEKWTLLLQPNQSHGKWGGVDPFNDIEPVKNIEGPVAVLTRARIRLGKFKAFWSSVEAVNDDLNIAPGRLTSIPIGETYHRVATFSVWDNADNMKAFAYKPGNHADVIKRAREENWLGEEMFTRFTIISSQGTLNGQDPLQGVGLN
ncbi:DUF3291 domain-containing protein [Mucilaginibacter sp. dw_454]|uniref:DUF3291 domain-containing protein n=1 Tax=Mucilaginibacter sp. dw_454 TaxID=2720079 RepID=UPI001BD62E68|nr:DUF3291 domain-containing protein [Mucilaginibacter sp. dw_454]